MPARHTTATPLVGRDDELAELIELLGVDVAATEPATRAVLLGGDAGVGKTRLLTELQRRAEAAGLQVLTGRCLDFGDSALPYLPFTELVGRLTTAAPELVDRVSSEHPALAQLQPGHRTLSAADASGSAGTERADLFEAVHAVLAALGQAARTLVVLEDVHWADHSTRDLLSFLLSRAFGGRVALVASYRSDDLHRRHPLRAATAQWSRIPGVHRFQLGPLDDGSVRELVRLLRPEPLPAAELNAIVARAEGNAFFAEELVSAVGSGTRAIPDDLADLLLLRIDQLDESAREVVRAVACAGREVDHALLAAVVPLGHDALDAALRTAVECHVLVPDGEAGYAFRHAMLAEAVYDDLLPGERVRLHAAFAEALRRGQVEGTAAELARHARAAHDLPTAVRANVEAGDEAMAVGGPDEAAHHYELALELLEDPGVVGALGPESVDVTALAVRAGDAVLAAGDPHRAVALLQEQLARLPSGTSDEDRARVLATLARASLLGDTGVDPLQATTELMSLVPAEPTALRACAMALHAAGNADRMRTDEALKWAAEAQQLGRELGLPRVVLDAATTLGRLEERLGNPERSRLTYERIVAEARARDDAEAELRGLHLLAAHHFEVGELTEAGRLYAEATRRSAESGRPWALYGFDAQDRVMVAMTAYVTGQWDDVLQITDLTGESPPGLAEAGLLSMRLAVGVGRGDPAAARVLESVRSWWERDGFVAIHSGAAGIDLQGDAGDVWAAVRMHDDVVATATRLWKVDVFLGQLRLSALLVGQLASAAARAAAEERSRLVAEGARVAELGRRAMASAESRHRRVGPEAVAWLARLEAEAVRLPWLAGDADRDAEALADAWRGAVDGFERLGHVFELARSRARLAAVLGAAGDTAGARAAADPARAVARDLGATPLLVELRGLPRSGGPARTGAPARDRRDEELTPREREILRLVADGRSNGDIARQLFISVKTVSVHVSNILAKTGAAGRTEAVAVARRRGLLADD